LLLLVYPEPDEVLTLRIARSHPDKMVLAVNQTKEEADSHFVELTKAYKACVSSLALLTTSMLTL
jgi:hypothetical protein